MTASLNGPRLAPKSGRARQFVVLLHGYGSNGDDLIELAHFWREILPDAAFAAPHAPAICAMAPGGRQWFPLTDLQPQKLLAGAEQTRPLLDAFLDQEGARHSVPPAQTALVGFSQGAMIALHCGLRRAVAPAGVVSLSGMLPGPERLSEATARRANGEPPPILLSHGDRDEVVPVGALFDAAEALAGANIPCQWHLALGSGHDVDKTALRHGGLFLAQCFGVPITLPGGVRK